MARNVVYKFSTIQEGILPLLLFDIMYNIAWFLQIIEALIKFIVLPITKV